MPRGTLSLSKCRAIPYNDVATVVTKYFGAYDVFWRESDRSFSGYVAECWFTTSPGDLATKFAKLVGYRITVRRIDDYYMMSIPTTVPEGEVTLGWASRGSRVKLKP